MALPTLVRSWQFNNNNSIVYSGSQQNDVKKVLWTMKNVLTTFPTNPWKCVASSNCAGVLRYGVDALGPPGPAYDNWGASFNPAYIWGREPDGYNYYDYTTSGKHSWIVLRNTALDTTYDICVDLYGNNNNREVIVDQSVGRMYACRSYNLTGSGTVTARPLPTSGYAEVELRNGNWDNYGTIVPMFRSTSTLVYGYRVHGQMSTDGLATRLFVYADGRLVAFWAFERILGTDPSVYINPVWACVRGKYDAYGDAATYGWLHDNATHQRDVNGTIGYNFYLSTEGVGGSAIGEAWGGFPNEVTNKYPMTPVGLASVNVGARGRFGYIADLWYGQTIIEGTAYPADGSAQFMSLNSLVVPWNGDMLYTN